MTPPSVFRLPAARWAALALATAPLLALTAASNQACTTEERIEAVPPIVIGATVDLTRQKDFGAGCQRVLRVAEQQLNAVGGVLGRRIVLDIRNDGGDDSLIAGIAKDFLDKKVAGFVGPSTTDALEVMQASFKTASTPILSPLTTSPSVPGLQQGRDRYLFRTSCATEYQARAIARYAIGRSFLPPEQAPPVDADGGVPVKSCKKMAAVFSADGRSTIGALKDELTKAGGTLVEIEVAAGAASYSAEVNRVVTAANAGEIECQTVHLFPADGGKFLRELRTTTAGNEAFSPEAFPTFGFIRFYQQGFIEAGRVDPKNTSEVSKTEGVLGAACEQERTTSPEWTRFDALYQSQFPSFADAASAPPPIPQIYDSVILLALAIEKARSLDDRVAIRDALYSVSAAPGTAYGPGQLAEAFDAVRNGRDIDYVGASGTFDLDDRGDTALDVIMWRVEGGSFVTQPGLDPRHLRN